MARHFFVRSLYGTLKAVRGFADHQIMRLLTASETAGVLGIAPYTLNVLVKKGALACGYYLADGGGGPVPGFLENDVRKLVSGKGNYVLTDRENYIAALKAKLEAECPEGLAVLRAFDRQFCAPPRKYYSLLKEPHKSLGFVYYVRYYDPEKKKLAGSKWSTHTNSLEEAGAFAEANRERLLAEYRKKKERKTDLFGVLEEYYREGPEYSGGAGTRGKPAGEHQRRISYSFITKKFVPWLKANRVQAAGDIEPALICRLQDRLLAEGMKPQTVNGYIRAARAVFEYMLRNGIIAENVFDRVKNIRVTARDRKTHGCYGLEKLAGVFDAEWEDRRSYMLSLLVYTTNMRNSEIERVRLKDIVEMDGCHFVSIPESKTESGERLVPLHPFTRRAMLVWAAETGKGPEDRLFLSGRKRNQSGLYRKAYLDMAARLGVDAERLRAENITYYSGRHFWKTLMSAEDLGDVEECFMGHKVTGNVKKLYDHKDKRGRDRMVKKARQVIGALDRCLFGGGPAENRAETLDTGEYYDSMGLCLRNKADGPEKQGDNKK